MLAATVALVTAYISVIGSIRATWHNDHGLVGAQSQQRHSLRGADAPGHRAQTPHLAMHASSPRFS
jgi:hypothetical protein